MIYSQPAITVHLPAHVHESADDSESDPGQSKTDCEQCQISDEREFTAGSAFPCRPEDRRDRRENVGDQTECGRYSLNNACTHEKPSY